jgi:hypothetical protein
MMRRIITAFMAVCWASVASMAMAAGPKWQHFITVKAADTSYTEVPVSVTLPAPQGATYAELREFGRKELVCYALVRGYDGGRGGKAEVTWIVCDLSKGASRRYVLRFRSGLHVLLPTPTVDLNQPEGAVEVWLGRHLFTRYDYASGPKPFCFPVIGPTGKPVTRSYPMEKVEGESTDHKHHHSFWFAHGNVNGQDFWGEGEGSGKIVHRALDQVESGYGAAIIRARNDWIAADGKKVCEDVRELRVYDVKQGRLMDFEVTLLATEGPVEFGDTKEGMMAVRVASSMEVTRGKGHIVNSEGVTDKEAWGKRADWCDYYGPVDGQTVGIAIFDHPSNFRHPTYWHVRDYGLFAANPFGVRDFVGKEAPSGAHTLAKGESLTFRYRIYIHEGDAQAAGIAGLYEQYAHPPVVRVY